MSLPPVSSYSEARALAYRIRGDEMMLQFLEFKHRILPKLSKDFVADDITLLKAFFQEREALQ